MPHVTIFENRVFRIFVGTENFSFFFFFGQKREKKRYPHFPISSAAVGQTNNKVVVLNQSRNRWFDWAKEISLIPRLLFSSPSPSQGCQIFLGTPYQNGKNIPNEHKIYQLAIKYTIRP
jgi:hypothetical protein